MKNWAEPNKKQSPGHLARLPCWNFSMDLLVACLSELEPRGCDREALTLRSGCLWARTRSSSVRGGRLLAAAPACLWRAPRACWPIRQLSLLTGVHRFILNHSLSQGAGATYTQIQARTVKTK